MRPIAREETRDGAAPRFVVDADVHAPVPSIESLLPYLSSYWQEWVRRLSFAGPTDTAYPPNAPTSVRPGINAEQLDSNELRRAIFEKGGAAFAIASCAYAIESIHNPYAALALAQAVNNWLLDEWTAQEPRLYTSVVVPCQEPDLAAREIARVGAHPQVVQVFLPVRSYLPYGKPLYHKVFAEAVRHDLVVGLHFGGATGHPPTGTGWPSYYVEEYAGMATAFQSQLLSLIAEGVFEKFPTLRLALIEGGFTWLPPFLWRFDKEWKGLRRETPWVKQPPSRYVRMHIRATLQPFDGPAGARLIERLHDQLDSEEFLMFATDYPHWHGTQRIDEILRGLSESVAERLMGTTARDFYALA